MRWRLTERNVLHRLTFPMTGQLLLRFGKIWSRGRHRDFVTVGVLVGTAKNHAGCQKKDDTCYYLEFGGIYEDSTVWINGHRAGDASMDTVHSGLRLQILYIQVRMRYWSKWIIQKSPQTVGIAALEFTVP